MASRTIRRMKGFTLIELMVTVSLLMVLTLLVAPSFNDAMLSNRLASYSNDFSSTIQIARSEAIKRNATVTLCRSANQSTCATTGGWEQGWIIRCPTSDGATCNAAGADNLVLSKSGSLASGFLMTGDAYSLDFPATVTGVTVANLKLCQSSPVGRQERTLRVSATGRLAVATTRTGTCS